MDVRKLRSMFLAGGPVSSGTLFLFFATPEGQRGCAWRKLNPSGGYFGAVGAGVCLRKLVFPFTRVGHAAAVQSPPAFYDAVLFFKRVGRSPCPVGPEVGSTAILTI